MRGQGSSGLWSLVIGLIALFIVATIVAPSITSQIRDGVSTGPNSDGSGTQALFFKVPAIVLASTNIEEAGGTNITVRATPAASTTGGGGSFAWILSIDGANGQGKDFPVTYGDQLVKWFAGENGSIVGIGPRFTQGPGAASMEASATFSIVADLAGSFTLKAWVAEVKDPNTIDPTNLKACSPVQSQSFQVTAKTSQGVTLVQSLSGPDSARMNSYTTYSLTAQAHATGSWSSPITTYIAVTKSNIRSSDVLGRVTTDRSYQSISWTDSGDRLIGTLTTSSPFQGAKGSESAEWTTSFELEFRTTAQYTIECWSVVSGTEHALGSPVTHDVDVRRTLSTTEETSATAPTTTVSTAPVVVPSTPVVSGSAAGDGPNNSSGAETPGSASVAPATGNGTSPTASANTTARNGTNSI
jgi:hypothetical protein